MENQFVGTFTIGQTLDRGIRLYKKAIKRIFILLLAPGLLGVLQMKDVMMVNPSHQSPFGMFTGLYFLNMLIGTWVFIVSTRYLYGLSEGKSYTFGEILKLAIPKDFLYIITYILFGIVMMVAMLLLVIPFIYLINLSYMALIICIVERKYFFEWLPRVFLLTKGRWWKTFVINIVVFIIMAIPIWVGMALMMTAASASAMQNFETAIDPSMESSFVIGPLAYVGAIIYMGAVSLVGPLLMTVNIVHYNSLRSEKESVDINQQLDNLDTPQDSN